MAYDDTKSNFTSRDDVPADEKLTADEYNALVEFLQNHSSEHESGGSDELNVSGLGGVLSDPQPPEAEAVQDIVGALIQSSGNISVTYDDANDTLTIDTSALNEEEVEDTIGNTVTGDSQVTAIYDDTAGTVTISVDAPTQGEFDNHSTRHEDGGSDEIDVSGLSGVLADAQTPQTEAVEDIVSGLLTAGTNIGLTYDDANGTLTVDTSALNEEEVEDAVAALVTAGNAITVNYDDANDSLSIAVDESSLSFYDGTNLTAPYDGPSVSTEEINNVFYPSPTGGGGEGQGSPPGSDPWTLDETELDGFLGRYILSEGRWITSGLATDDSLDWDSSPVSIEGEGIWVSQIEHEDGSSPTVQFNAAEGNGGGIRNLAVYGAGDGVGSANIVENDGDTIDFVFENVIIRYGSGDALNLTNPGGTRITNAWLENVPGAALKTSNMLYGKVVNLHTTSTDVGIDHAGSRNSFTNISITNCDSTGIKAGGGRNEFSNILIDNVNNHGILPSTGDNIFNNIVLLGVGINGMQFSSPRQQVNNVVARNWGGTVLNVASDDNQISNVHIQQDTANWNGTIAVQVGGDNNHLSDIYVTTAGMTIDVSGIENVIEGLYGVPYADVNDTGTRTLVNGWGTNGGDPNTTGQWNGNAAYAGKHGATIWDTSTSPWTPYIAAPDGSDWIAT